MTVHITGDPAADQVLNDDPFAVMVGMMLDQQHPIEHQYRCEDQGSAWARPRVSCEPGLPT